MNGKKPPNMYSLKSTGKRNASTFFCLFVLHYFPVLYENVTLILKVELHYEQNS